MSPNPASRPLPPAPNMHRPEISVRAWFNLGGYPLLVESNHSGVLQCAQEAFQAMDAAPEHADSPIRIRLLAHGRHDGAPLFDPVGSPPASYQDHAGLFSIVINRDNYAFGDLKGGYGFGYVTEDLLADCAYLRWYILEALALTLLTHQYQLLPLHASCVVQDGSAAIIAGSSGQGKSTLALSCVQHGLQFLSDDAVFLDCSSDPLRVLGLPQFARLAVSNVPLEPSSAGAVSRRLYLNGSWKVEVNMAESFPGSPVSSATLRQVILLAPQRVAAAALEPVQPGHALDRLEFLWPFATDPPAHKASCVQRVAKHGAYELQTSTDPKQAAALIVKLLKEAT